MNICNYKKENKTFIIAEIAQAHDGSFGILNSMIEAAASCGVDAVKFQVHISEAESSQYEKFRIKFSKIDNTRMDYWKRMEFSFDQWVYIKNKCENLGVEFLATPFSNAAVKLLEKLEVNKYKIGSGDIANTLLLEAISRMRKEVIFSTGLADEINIDNAVKFFEKKGIPFSILQCTTSYPTLAKDIHLDKISFFMEKFNCPVGLSDHSGKIFPGLAAAAIGASIVELHVTFDKKMFGPDSVASLNFEELKILVDGIRYINEAKSYKIETEDNEKN